MLLTGPYCYTVSVTNDRYLVLNDRGHNKFIHPVTTRCPKLYVFASDGSLHYVGQTIQGMAARMRLGFLADGSSGYHGYKWRRELPSVQLMVWCLEDVCRKDAVLALECIESEIVFAHRTTYGQWPKYQTEIHFHQSTEEHRALAAEVFRYFSSEAPENNRGTKV